MKMMNEIRAHKMGTVATVHVAAGVTVEARTPLALAHGALPATWKIVAPIPFQALLALFFVAYAGRPPKRRTNS
jgi:biotin-dependent enzyme